MTKQFHFAKTMRRGLAAAVAISAMLAGTSVAQAEVIQRESVSDSFSDVGEFCGIPIEIEGTFSFRAQFRVGKNNDATSFFQLEQLRQSATVTNPVTGKFFFIEGKSVIHDIKSTPLGGNLFGQVAIEAGQPFNILDPSGRVVIRNRGVVRTTVIFDTEGDAVPGGTTVEVVSVEPFGPHPGFDDAFFCSTIEGLLL